MNCLMPKPSQSFFKHFFFTEKQLFKEKGEWRIEENTKRRLFNCSHFGDYKGLHNVNNKAG